MQVSAIGSLSARAAGLVAGHDVRPFSFTEKTRARRRRRHGPEHSAGLFSRLDVPLAG